MNTPLTEAGRKIASIPLPFELAKIQTEDILTAAQQSSVGWYMDVGTGKTVCSTLTAILWDNKRNYILVPPIIIDQWEDWLRSIGETDIGVFRGPQRTVDLLQHKWVIMSHAIFRDSFTAVLESVPRSYSIIVDEAQYLKNPASKLFKYVKTMANGRHLQLLTGTPTSKPEDSYAYIHLLTKVYRSFGHWKNTHVEDVDFFGNIKTYKNLDLVTSNMKLLSFKRTKKDIFGHNLDPIYQVIPYSLDKAHQKLYEKLAEEQLLLLLDGGKIDASSPTRLYHALQQIVLQWSKFCGEPKRSAGYDVLDEVIEEVDPMDKSKSKLVVWTYYQHTSGEVVQYLRDKFGERAIAAAYGKVNSQKGIDAIMLDPECRILVAQPSSCGVGLNLQHVCSEMLFLELSTTPMQAKQAIGRVDRAGQKIRPTIRIAQAKRTIQVKLLQQLLANDDLVAKVEDLVSTLRGAIFGE